jgi:hypothetical protein
MHAGDAPDAEPRGGTDKGDLPMFTSIRSRFARAVLTAGLLGATAVVSLGAPAQAAVLDAASGDFWVQQYSDHTDIVVDWFAVPTAADDVANNLPACVAASELVGPLWLVDQFVCMNFVHDCAEAANDDPRYRGHPIYARFSQWKNECIVVGV